MEIKDIIIYPIKSLGGISVNHAKCKEEGLEHDRRMMLVDEDGKFITQRSFPQLALIAAEEVEGGFRFYHKNETSNSITIMNNSSAIKNINVTVWKHRFSAGVIREYGEWFSAIIGMKCHLVKMNSNSERHKSLIKAPSKTLLSMADGYPYLMISEESLIDLNRRLIVSVPMNRFRPNIVLSGVSTPYGEEDLDKIKLGDVPFRMIKGCVRCNMITIDQKTGQKLVEPLKTLSSYKKVGNNVYFGMNAVALSEGIIQIGDLVSEN